MFFQRQFRANLDRALFQAQREIRLLGSVTPNNACAERYRLLRSFEQGEPTMPRWSYARSAHSELRRRLSRLARRLETEHPEPLSLLYAERARELALEASIADAAGTYSLANRAAKRFAPYSPMHAARADILAAQWSALPVKSPPVIRLMSDAPDGGSLLVRLRAEVVRLRLGMRVEINSSLGALAATGEGVIFVAAGRPVSHEDVERTVVHEIMGHALPRLRAQRHALGLFAVGTARGSDAQEGLALLLEARHGFLGNRRKRELAARHLSVSWMRDGANFVEVVRALSERDLRVPQAVLIAERAFRGGDGVSPGLGRERVYLEALERVREHLELRPDDETTLSCGQVAIEAIDSLTALTSYDGSYPTRCRD